MNKNNWSHQSLIFEVYQFNRECNGEHIDVYQRKIKNELNQIIYDITSVWMCGVRRRRIGHNKAIYSWKNNRCTALNLEFKRL
ncbi:MAG TPA: hypothetical protein EYQ00_02010 [Dehalococcoidia bacterium]|nr:hypothetical protein [Dehalococcoidia bacterium]